MIANTKTCCNCKIEKDINMFNKAIANKDGRNGTCKICRAKYKKEYRQINKIEIAEKKKEFYNDNKEIISEKSKKSYIKNRVSILEYQSNYSKENKKLIAIRRKKYYEINKDIFAEKSKIHYKNNKVILAEKGVIYRKNNKVSIAIRRKNNREINKELINERKRNWYQLNKETVIKSVDKYRGSHKTQCNIVSERYRTRKKLLLSTLTFRQWEDIKKHFNNRCAYCNKELPLAQEHFIPLSKGGEYTAKNVIPSCKSCNSSKGNREFGIWFVKQKFYSKIREKIILKFLGYNNETQQLKII